MAGLVPAIHVLSAAKGDVDGRDKRGHDDYWLRRYAQPDSRGLVPGIHVFLSRAAKTWMAGQVRP
jgi:hypothetical protein